MKRSEALAILSRDHHQALVVASQLTRVNGATVHEARSRFLDYWTRHGRRHFRLEEELLLPAYASYGDPYNPLVQRVLGDHVAIRAQAARCQRLPDIAPEDLRELGQALAAHVRREERQLFPMIEDAMPADELLALALALERAEQDD